MTKQEDKKRVQKSWGLEAGMLVYKPTDIFDSDYSLGKIVSIWEKFNSVTCDVYWFGETPKLEEGVTMSQIREIKHFPR